MWTLSQSLSGFEDVKFEAAALLAEIIETIHQDALESSGQTHYISNNDAKAVLRKALELSQTTHVYWHCRLLFQLSVSYT